ncbi:MAG: type II secretion system protein [Luteolibacter sp.]|uniref:type IV pilus modification PilV family protein n=1 Tax=Luteolibacter sp. TaxID=1962973 RepID=UPI003266747E
MKTHFTKTSRNRGSSLIETVIAMGVLAIAIPLVFGAIAESGKSGMSSEAETRSSWIVPACMDEIQASRDGFPRFFTTTKAGQALPVGGSLWALGFSSEGEPVGKMDQALYDKGTKEIDGKPIRYIATISATPEVPAATPPMMLVKVTLEYPSTSPATKRQKLDFYTRIP